MLVLKSAMDKIACPGANGPIIKVGTTIELCYKYDLYLPFLKMKNNKPVARSSAACVRANSQAAASVNFLAAA